MSEEEDAEQSQEKSQKSEESEENKSQQDEQENEVKEERVEKEENEEPQETKEEPEKEEPEKEEPEKEEPEREEPEKEEPERDEQENREDADNEGEVPTEVIIFSNLSKEEKIKYFNFFIANDTIFNREPEGTWIAEIDIFEDDKQESEDLKLSKNEDMKKLRQSKFRTTKKDYDTIYSKLIKVINPPPGIKGTKMNLSAIKYMIQEIYSLKFLKDTQALFNKEDSESEDFPVFVGNFLINKFPKKDALHKKAIDFMLSLDFYGLKHKDIKIFQQFVTEEYDANDLIFYLFVRSCIEKELKVFFLEKAKENLGQGVYGQENDDIMIPVKKCEKLAKAIYGTDEEELSNEFMDNIKKLLDTDAADEKKKHLKANAILNMSLANYHDSRGKVDEADEDKENSDQEKEKEKKKKEKEKKKKDKKKHKKDKDDTKKKDKKSKKSKPKDEESEDEKKEEDSGEEKQEEKNEEEEEKNDEEEVTPAPKKTVLRGKKKPNPVSSSTQNPKTSSIKSKPSNVSNAPKTKVVGKTTNQNKINAPKTTPGISKPVKPSTEVNKSGRKISQEAKETNSSKLKLPAKRPVGSSSVGKRKITTSVGKRPGLNDQVEQTLEFKKILNKNRIEKVKTDADKNACLLYIINDYFKLKEIDTYFKNLVENNPIFKNFSAKIFANIKNTKEFTLKKLSGICKYISAGDKNGFNNFLKAKDRGGKNSFENMKSSYNSLLKSGPLKNLNENDIGEFCKMVLEIPELSVQTSKSLLKYCE